MFEIEEVGEGMCVYWIKEGSGSMLYSTVTNDIL